MSWVLLERVALTRGIPAAQKSVLIVLAQHAHNDGTNARPSQERIAAFAGMTPRNVRRCLASLEATGYIVPVLHGGPQNHTVNYSIRLDMLADNADNMSAFHSPNSDNMSAFDGDNPDISAQKGGHIRHVRRTYSTDKADNMSAESGKNHVMNQKKEEAERAQRASASFASPFEQKKETRSQSPEAALLAPFTDEEIRQWADDEESGTFGRPCETRRAVLFALWEASDHYDGVGDGGPHRAWLQYVDTFLDSGATPDEIMVGSYQLRHLAEDQNWEHRPGVKYLARHWDEWHSKAKLQILKDAADRRREEEALEAAERERAMWEQRRQHREEEEARRAGLTPEERAQEDADHAAIEQAYKEQEAQRHAERMAYMRAATAPRVEVS